jgi:hypothetical protein
MTLLAGGLIEPMKINVKKTNPAFKLRQLLPPLSGAPGRPGAAAPAGVKVVPPKSAATPVTSPSWVTTE